MTAAPVVTRHRVGLPRWTLPPLRIAVVSDTHASAPAVTEAALAEVAARTNALGADLILCPGDFVAGWMPFCRALPPERAVAPLGALTAPLGAWASLGNHDWKDDPVARATGHARTSVVEALAAAGLPLLRNEGRRLAHGGGTLWLAGLDSWQGEGKPRRPARRDDVDAALSDAPGGAPRIVMAHEPDAIAALAGRADLVVSGHTHGGQADLWGWRPMTPSAHGGRYARGVHVVEGTTMVVSAGIGFSGVPLRLRCPPEIVLIELGGPEWPRPRRATPLPRSG